MAPTSPGGSPAGAGRRRGPCRDHGAEAYGEARQRERDMVLPDGTTHARRTPAHWRRAALIVARPDVQISRIRLSDKTSRLRPRHVMSKRVGGLQSNAT